MRTDRKVNFQADEEVFQKIKILKKRYCINMSAFFRESIINLFNSLEREEEVDHK